MVEIHDRSDAKAHKQRFHINVAPDSIPERAMTHLGARGVTRTSARCFT